MVNRVVLGGCTLARRFARELSTWPGDLSVLVEDADAAERLREDGIAANQVDLTDPGAVATSAPDPVFVFVASDTPARHRIRLETARTAFPDAWLTAVSETGWPDATDLADQHVALDRLAAADVADLVTGTEFRRSMQLLRTLGSLEGPIAVVMHDNPDPDAIAAALGVVFLADSVDREAVPLYAGEITHQENRAFVNILDLDLERYDPPFDEDAYGAVVLVDHAHPGVNDQLSPQTAVDVVIDHHPSREEADAVFVDRRHDVGATSTLVADHILASQLDPDAQLTTALWYGIQVDTDGFRRGVSELDFEIAARLRDHVDDSLLDAIESPKMTARTLETIGSAIDNRAVHGDVLITSAGAIHDRDALAQAADGLLRMADIGTVLVYGWLEDTVYASARSRSNRVDVGDAMRLAFGQIGNAGGHEDMAGAQIPVGVLGLDTDEGDEGTVDDVIADRFIEGVEMASRPLPSGYVRNELAID